LPAGSVVIKRAKAPAATAPWSAPLLLMKEDLGITVAAVGVVLLVAGARKVVAALTVAGVAGCAVLLLVVIPR